MQIPPKLITVLALLQMLFIALGFVVTRSFLRQYESGAFYGESYAPKIPHLVLIVRNYGLWFLTIPLIWSTFAVLPGKSSRGGASVPGYQLLFGSVLTLGILVTFTMSAMLAIGLAFWIPHIVL
jgi:hypothetical protein